MILSKEEDLARLCGALANTTRIDILYKLAFKDNCEEQIHELEGGQNLPVDKVRKFRRKNRALP